MKIWEHSGPYESVTVWRLGKHDSQPGHFMVEVTGDCAISAKQFADMAKAVAASSKPANSDFITEERIVAKNTLHKMIMREAAAAGRRKPKPLLTCGKCGTRIHRDTAKSPCPFCGAKASAADV